jgi:hypothetical protein
LSIDISVRHALEEGVFGLCGMVGEHGRDWIYRNVEEEGRVVLKEIWAQYNKSRYTGKD